MKLKKFKQSVHNPLGIIAMFVTMIYGIACLVIGKGLPMLYMHCERMWLIQFVFWFPFVLLLAFAMLVIFFPTHLFGPGDYSSPEMYLKSLGRKETQEKLDVDVADVKDDIKKQVKPSSGATQPTSIPSSSELREIIQNIETKALLELNEKYGVVFRQNVKFGDKYHPMYLDGYAFFNHVHYVAEVKYMPYAVSGNLSMLMKQMYSIFGRLSQIGIINKTKIILCVVFDEKDPAFEENLKANICRISQDIDICLYKKDEI